MDTNFWQYGFLMRGLIAGIIIALVAPLPGLFLVLRRYSLIADTLAHVSLTGVALALFFGWPVPLAALGAVLIATFLIERLRQYKKLGSETALSLFLSGSLAVAIIIFSVAKKTGATLFQYLFGSIITVSWADIALIAVVGGSVACLVLALFQRLSAITFDEEAAQVAGLAVRRIDMFFMLGTAALIAVSISAVGVMLVAALMIVPVAAALQLKIGLRLTVVVAELISAGSAIAGIILSWYANLPATPAIVLILISVFGVFTGWQAVQSFRLGRRPPAKAA